jgi:serine/threonine protein phosphatase PrpC
MTTAMMSEVGRRSRNEDRYGTGEAGATRAWVVADGLGGHDSGDLAAAAAVAAALRSFDAPASTLTETAEAMIRSANEAVLSAREERAASTMSSTISLIVADAATLVWGHVGDTRIFRFREGNAEKLTRDHSVAESMRALSNGANREKENRNATVLLSSLGSPEMYYDVSALEDLHAGDVFLIASDGLWGVVPLKTMASELHSAPSLEKWLDRLRWRVERQNDPEQDNFTAVAFGADLEPGATLGGRGASRGWRAMFGWS